MDVENVSDTTMVKFLDVINSNKLSWEDHIFGISEKLTRTQV